MLERVLTNNGFRKQLTMVDDIAQLYLHRAQCFDELQEFQKG
jgi:hypothetical protein